MSKPSDKPTPSPKGRERLLTYDQLSQRFLDISHKFSPDDYGKIVILMADGRVLMFTCAASATHYQMQTDMLSIQRRIGGDQEVIGPIEIDRDGKIIPFKKLPLG